MKIKVYGSRGSVPRFCRNNLKYGGNTPCMLIDADGHLLLIDAGSGLMDFASELAAVNSSVKLDILLSHLHYDHIIGLPMFSALWNPNNNIRIFTKNRGTAPLSEQVFGAFKPPYWPIPVASLSHAELLEIKETEPLSLGDGVSVTAFPAAHRDATTSFRVEHGGKSFVYLLDFELREIATELEDFCRDADLLVFDASYMPEDYELRRGWGHSTWESGIALAKASGCKRLLLAHFDQKYTDSELDALAQALEGVEPYCVPAYDGLEMEL